MKRKIEAAALVFTLLAAMVQAQEDGTIRSEVSQIFVPVSVTTIDGNPIENLTRSQFHLLEDGMEQEILNMARDEVPLNVVFLMDASHSEFMEVAAIKRAIRTFSENMDPRDRFAMVTFNSEARLILDWCNDIKRLDKALDRVAPKGNTVWYDALYVTFKDLLPSVKGKKVIISVTDGWDTGSIQSFADVLEESTKTDVQLYVVSKTAGIKDYAEYFSREHGYKYDETNLAKTMYACESQLRKLANDTGGRLIVPQQGEGLSILYKKILKELRMQYYLSYQPHNIVKDGQYRKITVRVDKTQAVVHHRPGYYAK